MNLIALIILVAIIADFLLNFTADLLNLNMLQKDLPEEFQDIYDADQYRKSQDYLKVNTQFGWVSGYLSIFILLIFWFSGGFKLLDTWVRSLSFGPIFSGILYIGTLVLIKAIISLPFQIYETFIIEERFGFNKTTWTTFIKDIIKGIILGLLLGVPLLTAVLAFFEFTEPHAWIYCWIGMTVFMLILQYIVPTWIMPLFNKFTPLEEGELRTAIMTYAQKINFPLQNVFVMDGSKRSSKSNAFFTGFGKHKRIVLFDTLIKQHSTAELVAVLAHEMGHFKQKHILKTMLLGILQMGIMLYVMSLFISQQILFDAFYLDQVSIYAGLVFFGMLYSPIDFFLGIFMQIYSRKNEFEADQFAVKSTNDHQSLGDALKGLSVNNLSNLMPHPLYVFLNYSHPPVLERLQRMKTYLGT